MIHVKWGRDVLHFPIPPPDTPLGQLRADLAAYTHLPVGSFKLVYKGAVMKEDNAPLSTYKLVENATIALIGGHVLGEKEVVSHSHSQSPTPTPRLTSSTTMHKTTTSVPSEANTIAAIRAELERVRETLVPDVDAFVWALGSDETVARSRSTPMPTLTPTPTPLDHTRLSELLLQSLLRLDALHVSGADWPEARTQRKAAVKEVQGVLDRLDGAWAAR